MRIPRAVGRRMCPGIRSGTKLLALAAVLVVWLAAPERANACTLTTTGATRVNAGSLFTLTLGATDTGDGLPTSWTINWGDGHIDSFAGNPASVTHTYDGVIPSSFTYNILASAVCSGRTYFQNDLVVPSAVTDTVNWYTHDATTNTAVTRAPVQSGPDAGLDYPLDAIIGRDGNLYVSGLEEGNVVRYNPTTGAFIDEFVDGVPLVPTRTRAAGIAFGPDGHLYVVFRDTSEVLRFNGATGAFIDVFVTAGSGGIAEPEGLTFGPDGRVYVTDFRNNQVYRFNGRTGAFIDVFVTGVDAPRDPEDLVFGPDGNGDGELDLYVASDRDHEVKRYQGPGGASPGAYIDDFVIRRSGGLDNAQGVAFGPDGHFYVSSWRDDSVYRYDGTTGAFIDQYVSAGLGGLNTAEYFDFIPGHQVEVVNLFRYYKPITVRRSRIPGGCGTTLANYPMLFSVTDPDLAHTTSGGAVMDVQGDDIVFEALDDATCGGAGLAPCTLDHEIEKYVSTTGELVAWVRIPSVNTASAASNTVIYIHYGNTTVTSPTENPAGVWDANHVAVWHLKESGNGTAGEFKDSTSNANHGRGGAGVAARVPVQITTGKIGNGQTFDNNNDKIQVPNSASLGITGNISVSTWINRNVVDWAAFLTKTDLSSTYDYQFLVSVSDTLGLWADGASPTVVNTSVTFTDTTAWHHLAVSKSGNNVTFYIDGAVAAGGGVQTGGFNNNPDPVVIGYDNEASSAIGADLDELRLSNAARSACWVGAEYENGNDPGDIGSPGFYIVGAATAVELVSFEAVALDGAVELSWETGSELDNLGFELYRSKSEEGPWERITQSLIPGLGSSPEGARYRYVDRGLTNGVAHYYELEDVETTGRVERHGPVSATPSAAAGSGLANDGDGTTRLTYGEPEASAFRIEPKKNGVVLTLHTGGFEAVAQDDGSVTLEVPGLEDVVGSSLPLKRAWVEALAGRDVKVVSVRATGLERFAGLRPRGELVAELEASVNGTVRARLMRRGRRRLQREGAELIETAYQGETKKALFELSPFAWDGSGLVLATTLEVRVAFRGREPSVRVARRKGKASVRLVTVEPGLYAVPLRELAGRSRVVRLSRQGDDVAYHVEDDVLYFWSEGAAENPYGSESVYELERGVAGRMMELSAPGSETGWYWEELEQEENRYYQAALVEAPDVWLWDLLLAPQRKAYTFDVHEPVSGPAHLEVWLQGTSDVGAGEDHHVRVYVNGIYVTESRWGGKTARTLSVELAADVLRDGENTLELESVADTGATYSSVMLDRFRVRYQRQATVLHRARYVLDVSGDAPTWVDSTTGFDPDGRYAATNVVHRPELRPVLRTKLRTRRRTDYLVIAPEAFVQTARPLLRHRRRQGLRVTTASTEAIASEFGDGELTPESIREFIADVYHNGRGQKLRYVLLLGDATYDYKDYMGTGVVNQVPPFMVKTSFLWTASDPTYAAVNGDDVLPDLSIGRLPAASVDELRTMVEKILAYETGEASMEAPIVLVSDNPDEAGDFPADAQALADTVLAEHAPRHISLGTLGAVPARQAILHAFDDGASVLSYIGHGGINLWASENLLNLKSVDSLQPQSQQPVVLTMNCLNGYFHFPFFNSLSEALVKAEGKGAIAAFSPSGLSLNGPAHRYHQELLNELFHGNHRRLGDAVMAAQKTYVETGSFPELVSIYHLLGDPALTLR